MAKTNNQSAASMENIYSLDGRVPLLKSIPFGLQHVLAMFVANIAPIMIVTGASGLSVQETASLIQTAMIMAGIGTLVQLFTVWKLGAKLPIVMGISFTFVSVFCYVGPQWGYEAIIGAVIGISTQVAAIVRSNVQGRDQQNIQIRQWNEQMSFTRARAGFSTHAASIGEDL